MSAARSLAVLRAALFGALALALLGAAPPSNECISRGFIFSNIGTLYTWSGSAPSGWSGSSQMATFADFDAYVKNSGACIPTGEASNYLITYGESINCAVNATTHSPILANNSFAGGSSASWTLTNSCGTGYTQAVLNASDPDSDSGYYDFFAYGASGVSGCASTIAQTFSISGTPTNGSLSFDYRGTAPAATGDTIDCPSGNVNGSAGLQLAINGTALVLTGLAIDGAWHAYTAPASALTTGSNTVSFQTSASAAESDTYNSTVQACRIPTYAISSMDIDNVVLTASY